MLEGSNGWVSNMIAGVSGAHGSDLESSSVCLVREFYQFVLESNVIQHVMLDNCRYMIVKTVR